LPVKLSEVNRETGMSDSFNLNCEMPQVTPLTIGETRCRRSDAIEGSGAAQNGQSISQRLSALMQLYSGQIALTSPSDETLNFRQLHHQISALVNALNLRGIGRGDRVALVLPDGLVSAVTFLGVASGATSAPLNPSYREQEFISMFDDLRPKAVIVEAESDVAAVGAAKARSIPLLRLSLARDDGSSNFLLQGEAIGPPVPTGFASAADVALMLFTSGTTARPKLVPLTHANLLASASNIATTLELSSNDRCLNIMPLFHIHGLVGGLLAPLIRGGSVVCPTEFSAPQFFNWLKEFQPSWYTAVPTMHQAILAQATANSDIIRPYPLRFIRSSSAALPRQVMEDLETTFNAPVIESYGMTEASHQMASNPLPPGKRKPGSVGKAAGPEIAIMDEEGSLQPASTIGEVVIRGANVMQGYVDNSDANTRAYTRGWFRTGDQGYLDGDGYLFLTGRIKELINRGGEKISPREIDDVLTAHSAVEQAVAFAVPHATLGEEVVAAVVLRPAAKAEARELREFAATKLSDFKVPRQIVIVDEIPKSPTGKLQRRSLAEQLAGQLNVEYIAPLNELKRALANIVAEVLGVDHVGATENFFALGGDSLRATQVIGRIRAMFDVNLSIATVFRKSTVAELADEIVQEMADTERG
jgi:acyl-CoA synthetase (AMP-forming)/AMP-acid ligase II/acyl carrier protein